MQHSGGSSTRRLLLMALEIYEVPLDRVTLNVGLQQEGFPRWIASMPKQAVIDFAEIRPLFPLPARS